MLYLFRGGCDWKRAKNGVSQIRELGGKKMFGVEGGTVFRLPMALTTAQCRIFGCSQYTS